MANVKAGNTIFVDTTGTLSADKTQRISFIIFTATTAAGNIVITDSSDQTKIKLYGATANDSKSFDLSESPVSLANGIKVTVTNAVATLILSSAGA